MDWSSNQGILSCMSVMYILLLFQSSTKLFVLTNASAMVLFILLVCWLRMVKIKEEVEFNIWVNMLKNQEHTLDREMIYDIPKKDISVNWELKAGRDHRWLNPLSPREFRNVTEAMKISQLVGWGIELILSSY